MASSGVVVVIPARQEAERVDATVTAAARIPGVERVVVVDDGSTDGTASLARRAGAHVERHAHSRGKSAAMTTGAAAAAAVHPRYALLFIDADLGGTAAATEPLIAPVLERAADVTIALLPPQRLPGGGQAGGHGLVVGLARRGVEAATGWTPTQPLSGMRCLTRRAFDLALPLAPGWGVETAMTIDLLLAGQRVLEVPCDLHHRGTGTDWRSHVHRAHQYRDVARALAARRVLVAPLALMNPPGVRR